MARRRAPVDPPVEHAEVDREAGVPDWVVHQALMAEADFLVGHYRSHLTGRGGGGDPPPPSDVERIRAILASL